MLIQPVMGGFENSRGRLIEPTGLLYLARLVVQDYTVRILDQRVEGRAFFGTLEALLRQKPLCVGLTTSAGTQLRHALEISRFVKRVSDVPVVFGGPFASQAPAEFMAESSVDYVVMGEGEQTLKSILDRLREGGTPQGIPGVFYRDGAGVGYTPPDGFLDLDELPEVPFHLLQASRYYSVGYGRRTVQVETSRGCPQKCGYCYNTVVHRSSWRPMSAARSLDLVRQSLRDTGTTRVYFTDDNFFLDLKRAFAIVRGLRDLGISWGVQGVCMRDVLRMDHEMLTLLQESGCQGLLVGIQSGSQRIHDLYRTDVDLQDATRVNEILAKYRIPCWYYFMCGFPTETMDELRATAQLAASLLERNPWAVTSAFFIATPYPGTLLYARAREFGWPERMTLDDWASIGWNSATQPWLTPERRRVLEGMYFLSLFHDRKTDHYVSSLPVKIFATLYRPLARYRLRNLDLRLFGLEALLWKVVASVIFK